jgi:6-phosphogluconolactonase (cycloisomerase 2 family)
LGSGVPAAPSGPRVNPNGTVSALAVDPSQKFLYVVDQHSHIDTYRIAQDGTLPAESNFSFQTAAARFSLGALAVEPQGRFLYVGNARDKTVYTFEIDSATTLKATTSTQRTS